MNREFRDIVMPLLWLLIACMLIGGALGTAISHAEPLRPQQICQRLDNNPTDAGLALLLVDLICDGHSSDEISSARWPVP